MCSRVLLAPTYDTLSRNNEYRQWQVIVSYYQKENSIFLKFICDIYHSCNQLYNDTVIFKNTIVS